MKILVISDTHGKLNRVYDIWPKLKDIDLIAHAGDHYEDALILGEDLGVPVVAVAGNCDSGRRCACEGSIRVQTGSDGEFEEFRYMSSGDMGIIETEAGNIMITHGHREHVSYDLTNLMYKALENDCSMVIFGHTHCGLTDEAGGVKFLNPGSLSLPRDGSGGSYAIVRTDEDDIRASIVYYNTVMGGSRGGSSVESHGGHGGAGEGERTKSSGSGVIKSLLNYADRF